MPVAISVLPILLVLLLVAPPAVPLGTTEIEFVTPDLPWAIAEKGYEAPPLEVRVSGSCPIGGVGYAVVSGALPPGMQLSRLGYFSGTPLRTGEFVFTVRASNGCGWTGKRFTLVVTGAPIIKATPVNISFACKADETPVPQQIRVSATWPQLRYLLTMSNAAWLTATPEHGATPRHGSGMADDIVHLSVSTIGLKPGRYSATITVSSWQALEPVRVEVELKVN